MSRGDLGVVGTQLGRTQVCMLCASKPSDTLRGSIRACGPGVDHSAHSGEHERLHPGVVWILWILRIPGRARYPQHGYLTPPGIRILGYSRIFVPRAISPLRVEFSSRNLIFLTAAELYIYLKQFFYCIGNGYTIKDIEHTHATE